jgi:predicted dehydrogenase
VKRWKIAGINFDHMHMGDLLRQAKEHPSAEVVGVSDEHPDRVWPVVEHAGLPRDLFWDDYQKMLEETRPDVIILCPATAKHAEWVENVAPFGSHVLIEKPFAATVAEADRMIAATGKTKKRLMINWPLRWYPSHATAKRLVDEGMIGEVTQIHYYDGNRGPMRHMAGKVGVPEAIANAQKAKSWWYQKESGGGSLFDYLGYGTTLGTWFMNGRTPVEVTAMVDQPKGLEVDEHSISIFRYEIEGSGLSKFETRWGAFSDPWQAQPQPKCGFVIVGREGTISSYDYENTIRVQTRDREAGFDVPVDVMRPPMDGPINYFLDCLETGREIEGPVSPEISRIGQQMVDAAARSAREGRRVSL